MTKWCHPIMTVIPKVTMERKKMSRLAMAAADWMEEEEDELNLYWERYDNAKQSKTPKPDLTNVPNDESTTTSALSTEELLNRYFQKFGIDKRTEKEHVDEILRALEIANAVTTQPTQAIRVLEEVRPYLQIKSRLGGNALLELGAAYEDNDEYDKARDIYESLKENPERDIKGRVRTALLNVGKKNPKGLFGGAFWFVPFRD
mmetsp:Transcript_32025/g.47115  ORF Transcript_32025/g.47115 Transcript_32025/m.47115 type:complete len:203 (+) Transcript_32025:210-818(+)